MTPKIHCSEEKHPKKTYLACVKQTGESQLSYSPGATALLKVKAKKKPESAATADESCLYFYKKGTA